MILRTGNIVATGDFSSDTQSFSNSIVIQFETQEAMDKAISSRQCVFTYLDEQAGNELEESDNHGQPGDVIYEVSN